MFEEGPEKLSKEHIWAEVPEVNGTELIVQRHEEYNRDPLDPNVGSLHPEAATRANEQTYRVFHQMIEKVPDELRKFVDVMVVGSPTQYMGGGRRSMETATQVLGGIRKVFEEYYMASSQLLNDQPGLKLNGQPRQSKAIVEPKIFQDNPEFVEWLMAEYGNGAVNQGFFAAYESDQGEVRERRLAAGAEGHFDSGDRLGNYLHTLSRYSNIYHRNHPGRMLYIWTVSHYDTISPFIKTRLGGDKDRFMPVDYGGGFAVNIGPDGTATTTIGGKVYPISLVKTATASSRE